MATLTYHSHPPRRAPSLPTLAALILALMAAFVAGRATASRHPAPRPLPGLPATVEPSPPPPWSTRGFRDDERARSDCVAPDCTG